MQKRLHICLLGQFALAWGETPVASLNTARLQSILAYLLLHRAAPQPRQHLAFLLWPDTTEAQAQTNLRQLVHRLRAAVPQIDSYLLIGSRTLQWNGAAPFTLDVLEFERLLTEAAMMASDPGAREHRLQRLQAAVTLYTGDLLPSLYYEWIISEREQLRQRYMEALEALTTSLSHVGRFGEALLYAEQLKSADPLRESAYRTLMELSVATKDYARAVRYYQECAALLEQELGVSPGQATQEAYQRVMQQTALPKADQIASLAGSATQQKQPTHLPTLSTTFVGSQTAGIAVQALAGQEGVHVLTLGGSPSVGKTRRVLHTAFSFLNQFPDGGYLVALAPLNDPKLVQATIAGVLGIHEQPPQPIGASVTEWVSDKVVLLLLDNCEHVHDAAGYVSSLLASCPHLKILATSGAALER